MGEKTSPDIPKTTNNGTHVAINTIIIVAIICISAITGYTISTLSTRNRINNYPGIGDIRNFNKDNNHFRTNSNPRDAEPEDMNAKKEDSTKETQKRINNEQPNSKRQIARVKLKNTDYATLALESLIIAILTSYLIVTDFNHKTAKESFKNSGHSLTYVLSVIIITVTLFGIEILITALI